ncbi:trypsin-like peptidase domain-containing protein [Streptomyces sp. NPDC047097]|uniref:S1C family serine protease n=1 Tax=Streptomyces sp. NPDC047097 TaxID=3155260 RepID=UPI00340213DA
MSTENEGNAVPPAPSDPPVPPSTSPSPAPGHQGAAPVSAEGPAASDRPHQAPPPPPAHAPSTPPYGGTGDPAGPSGPGTSSPYENPPAHASAPSYNTPTPTPYGQNTGTPAGGAPAGGWPPPPPATPVWGAPVPPGADQPAGRKRSGGLVAAVLIAALVAGGVGGGIGYWAAERGGISSTTVAAGDAPGSFKRDPGTVAAVANKALPSVVTIEAKSGGSGGAEGEGGTGTGFVFDKEGHILTNNHVVASAAEGGKLRATFSNGKSYEAEVVGRAEGYDVAVLKLRQAPSGLTPLPLGNSDRVAVGDSTIAIGAPFGLSNTVTTGIVSAKDRPVASGDGGGGASSYMSALQTDASINPGNSGGPLLDARGAVIGINSAIQSPGGGGLGQSQAGSVGLGFAIPVNQAQTVARQLIKEGQPVYPLIGATVNMTTDGGDGGARIADDGEGGSAAVTPNGPAAKAGLKPGDVITKFGDRTIDSGPTLISEIWTYKPGDKVSLTYQRSGKSDTVEVTLDQRKGDR